MTIVLNEHEWARDMIENRSLGKKAFETLTRVARYYLDGGMQKREVRKLLDEFLLRCNPTASLPKWSNTLDWALRRALKSKAVIIDYIPVTEEEMSKIDALDGRQIRRLAFTLLCLSKYWDAVNPYGDHWVNTKQQEIMKMANTEPSLRRQCAMYNALQQMGYIDFSKKVDNTNVRVLFSGGEHEAMRVTDFRNLGYQYLMYHGEPYFECANCGIVTKLNSGGEGRGRPQKYCRECAAEIQLKQMVNHVMAGRKKPPVSS